MQVSVKDPNFTYETTRLEELLEIVTYLDNISSAIDSTESYWKDAMSDTYRNKFRTEVDSLRESYSKLRNYAEETYSAMASNFGGFYG